MKKPLRRTNNTILLAVEGYTDEAFTRHLKLIYCTRDLPISVTIKNAKGKGPEGVADTIKSVMRTANFNHIGAIYDGDLCAAPNTKKFFIENKITEFISSPSIEATLLSVLGLKIGRNTDECKALIERHLSGESTEQNFYTKHFPRTVLERGRITTSRLNDLIIFMTRR
ncbi:hypothetical protein [Pseudomonas sp. NY15374]|uniref:hypothetical protein n=1 Tax=Pseudomonas sp. NY15374 TaxID=3400357 RepID=UPI003A8B6DF9